MTDRPIVAVGAVIIEDGRLLVVERARAPHVGRWAVPGGRIEHGEPLVRAVEREVREETGLEVAVGDIAWVGDTIGPGDPPEWHFVIVDFFARRLAGTAAAADDAARIGWVPLGEAESWPMVDTMFELIESLTSGGMA